MVRLAKDTCKRSGNRLPSFYPHSPLLSTPGALAGTPKVPMGPQTCWKSCGTLPWRSWTLGIAVNFHPLRGRSCGVPAGPIWEKQTSMRASSCKLGCDVWPVRLTKSFFGMLRPLSRLFLWQHLATLKGQKIEIDSCKWSYLQKSLARGEATDCRPLIPPLLSTPGALAMAPRCRWGRRPAGSLAQLSPGEVELC